MAVRATSAPNHGACASPVAARAATAMLSLNVALGSALAAQGVAQLVAGVGVKPGEIIAMMASFAVMTVVAAALLLPLLRRLPPSPDPVEPQLATARQ
jgi:hypothetical protein